MFKALTFSEHAGGLHHDSLSNGKSMWVKGRSTEWIGDRHRFLLYWPVKRSLEVGRAVGVPDQSSRHATQTRLGLSLSAYTFSRAEATSTRPELTGSTKPRTNQSPATTKI